MGKEQMNAGWHGLSSIQELETRGSEVEGHPHRV